MESVKTWFRERHDLMGRDCPWLPFLDPRSHRPTPCMSQRIQVQPLTVHITSHWQLKERSVFKLHANLSHVRIRLGLTFLTFGHGSVGFVVRSRIRFIHNSENFIIQNYYCEILTVICLPTDPYKIFTAVIFLFPGYWCEKLYIYIPHLHVHGWRALKMLAIFSVS